MFHQSDQGDIKQGYSADGEEDSKYSIRIDGDTDPLLGERGGWIDFFAKGIHCVRIAESNKLTTRTNEVAEAGMGHVVVAGEDQGSKEDSSCYEEDLTELDRAFFLGFVNLHCSHPTSGKGT